MRQRQHQEDDGPVAGGMRRHGHRAGPEIVRCTSARRARAPAGKGRSASRGAARRSFVGWSRRQPTRWSDQRKVKVPSSGRVVAPHRSDCRTAGGRCRWSAPRRRRTASESASLKWARAAAPTEAASAPSSSTTHSASSALGWSMLFACRGALATSRSFSAADGAHHAGPRDDSRQDRLLQPRDQRLAFARVGHEAHGGDRAADAVRRGRPGYAQRQPAKLGEACAITAWVHGVWLASSCR